AGRVDAARPMIFETAADDADVVGQQCRRDRIAGEAFVAHAIEGEPQRLAAIDRTTFRHAHRLAHAIGSDPVTACVSVSRDSMNPRPHPAVSIHSSRSAPLTFFRKYRYSAQALSSAARSGRFMPASPA